MSMFPPGYGTFARSIERAREKAETPTEPIEYVFPDDPFMCAFEDAVAEEFKKDASSHSTPANQ